MKYNKPQPIKVSFRSHEADQRIDRSSAGASSLASILMRGIACAAPISAQESYAFVEPPFVYPETIREDIVDEFFGITVPDPYRWLEGEVGSDVQVAEWVASQRELTDDYLSNLEQRKYFQKCLLDHYDFDEVSIPSQMGEHLF